MDYWELIVLIIIQFICSIVLAGFPPTTFKGQSQSGTAPATFNFLAPFNQATIVPAGAGLVETGNTNILANPGFEATTYSTGWTASGGSSTAETTNPLYGVQSYNWDSNSAAQTLTSAAVTIPIGMRGVSAEVNCLIKTPSGTATHTITAFDGTSNVGTPITVTSSATPTRSRETFTMPTSGTIALKITSVNANEPSITIDDCYVGPVKPTAFAGNGPSEWVTFGGASNATTCTGTCTLYVNSSGVSSVTRNGTGDYTINFSAGAFTSPPSCTCIAANLGVANETCVPTTTVVTTTAFRINTVTLANVGNDAFASVVCSGAR